MYKYTATTGNNTNTITITTKETEAEAVIKVNGTAIDSGDSATWLEDENEVVITVTNGKYTRVYTIIVTKGE